MAAGSFRGLLPSGPHTCASYPATAHQHSGVPPEGAAAALSTTDHWSPGAASAHSTWKLCARCGHMTFQG